MTRRARPPGGQARDVGMTLAEMLVTIGLLTVLTAMISTVSILGIRTVDQVSTRLDSSTRGEIAMAAVSKVLRTAVLPGQLDQLTCTGCATTALTTATPTRVTFYANLDSAGQGPSLVTLEVIEDSGANAGTGVLRVTSQRPVTAAGGGYSYCNPATTGCAATRRDVARGLVWPSPAVFGYVDLDGVPMGTAGVAADDLGRVSSVEVSLAVRSKAGGRYTTSTTIGRVSMPNVEINLRQGG